jgi:hypothetical protein
MIVCVCSVNVWLTAVLCRKPGALAMAEMVSVVLTVMGPE